MSQLPLPPASRQLGDGGPNISPIAWGMWRLAEGGRTAAEAAKLVHAVLDAGITLLDTADIYGFDGTQGFGDAEALLGEVLAAEAGLRGRMVLSTKGGILPPLPYDQSAGYLAEAIDASLRRLRTDHVDLWQVHRPDILAHPQEVARLLDDAVQAGKTRHWACPTSRPARLPRCSSSSTTSWLPPSRKSVRCISPVSRMARWIRR